MILVVYIAIILVVTWGVPALILWLLFDMEFPIALLIGALSGSFLLSLLNAFDFPIMKRKKRAKKGVDDGSSPTGDGTTPPPGA